MRGLFILFMCCFVLVTEKEFVKKS